VRVRWVPSHLKIPRNEEADKAAKEGTMLPPPSNSICTLASLKRIAKADAKEAAIRLWNTIALPNYKALQISYSSSLSLLRHKRQAAGRIIASRTLHGDFADYHTRFNYTEANNKCSCGKNKSPLHFYFCRKSKAAKTLCKQPPSEAIPWLLGTAAGTKRLAEWLVATKFYQQICLRHSSPSLLD
jgi:hypothetical protein